MIVATWSTWGADWELGDKVSFDGINKIIYVHPEVTAFDIRADLYSSWMSWIALYDHVKFLPAVRVTGFDPIGPGVYTGDTYFLINGWKLSINLQTTKVTGVLYSDDYDTAYYTDQLVAQYPATVSSLVTTVSTGGGSGGSTASEIWSYGSRSLTTAFPTAPTVSQIRAEMDTNSTKLESIKTKVDTLTNGPDAATIADQVRTELSPELAHILTLQNNPGLTSPQATMLLELYQIFGLDPTKPLTVTDFVRSAGPINQTITTDTSHTVVQRI